MAPMKVISDRERLLRTVVYPGMDPEESRVLRAFIRKHGAEYDEFRFNVRVGPGDQIGEEFDAAVRRSIEAVTKARPDTVAWTAPNRATIIEVKVAWMNEAVWQLLGYRDAYRQTFPDDVVTVIGVAAWASTSARALARSQGVPLYLYAFPADVVDITAPATEEAPDGV